MQRRPDRFRSTELAEGAGTSFPTAQREINRAEQAGIVTERRVGPARLVRADAAHPLFGALRQLLVATFGPPAVIAPEFAGIDGALAVVLFGSWAARSYRSSSTTSAPAWPGSWPTCPLGRG